MITFYTMFESPFQSILLTSNGMALTGLYLNEQINGVQRDADWICDPEAAPFAQVREQLAAYFKGKLTRFDLPLAPNGTEFQLRVWNALTEIPCGETISYGELARRIGSPNASRAVGLANSRNQISIIVPCHRVIGANGKLTGYAGGIDNKAALLKLEESHSSSKVLTLFA